MSLLLPFFCFFFFIDTPTTEIYTLPYTTLFRSGKDVLVVGGGDSALETAIALGLAGARVTVSPNAIAVDRKSTRLNSSHEWISYAVFCLKKKKHHLSRDELQPGPQRHCCEKRPA